MVYNWIQGIIGLTLPIVGWLINISYHSALINVHQYGRMLSWEVFHCCIWMQYHCNICTSILAIHSKLINLEYRNDQLWILVPTFSFAYFNNYRRTTSCCWKVVQEQKETRHVTKWTHLCWEIYTMHKWTNATPQWSKLINCSYIMFLLHCIPNHHVIIWFRPLSVATVTQNVITGRSWHCH